MSVADPTKSPEPVTDQVVWFDLDPPPPAPTGWRRHRNRIFIIVGLVVVTLAAGVAVQAGLLSSNAKSSAAGSAADATATDGVTVGQLLSTQGKAVTEGDKASWLAQVEPTRPDVIRAYADLFDNLQVLQVGYWRHFDLGASQLQATRPGEYHIQLSYCLGGADCLLADSFVRVPLTYRITAHNGRLWLAAPPEPATNEPFARAPFWTTKLVTKVGKRTIVATPPARDGVLAGASQAADEAAAAADAFLHHKMPWKYVIYLGPKAEFQKWYGGVEFDRNAVAFAISLSDDFSDIVVNLDGLASTPFRTMLQHEMGHVVTYQGGAGQITPAYDWVREGVAEYIAAVGEPLARYYRITDVRHYLDQHTLRSIQDVHFGGTAEENSAAYGLAFLEMKCIATKYGEDKMLSFVRAQLQQDIQLSIAARLYLGAEWITVDTECRDYIRSVAG